LLIGYARVLTGDQNFDLQLDALARAGCERVFQDEASGARPGLAQALSRLRTGDTLVVWKLDRLGRTVRQFVAFVDELKARNIGFRSLTDSIDTATLVGQFFFHVMSALAEMERDLVRERTGAGLAAAKARGRAGGRPPKLSRQQITQACRLLTDAQTSVGEVATSLGVARSTLYRAIGRRPEPVTAVPEAVRP
jgi:DNA invertase Pin-like site-specific DNA recombinase